MTINLLSYNLANYGNACGRWLNVIDAQTRWYWPGIAISRHLAELIGGIVSVVSGAVAGSTFSFIIPLRMQAPAQPDRKVGFALLRRLGCQVDVAADGQQGCEMAAHAPNDLILMDCLMPDMGGYEATHIIRKRENAGLHTPVIAMTAGAMKGDRACCLEAGMDDYLSKPASLDALQGMLTKWRRSVCPTDGQNKWR